MKDQQIENELKERREQILRDKASGKPWKEQWRLFILDEVKYFKGVK